MSSIAAQAPAAALPAPAAPAPIRPIPAIVSRAMILDLAHGLPDPIDDTPAGRAERDHAAIAEVALLAPADAGEMRIAIRCVTTDAWANAWLRTMNAHSNDMPALQRITVQATSVARVANANRALLQAVQTQRRKLAADPAAAAADAQAEQAAQHSLLQAWHAESEELAQPLEKAPPPAAADHAKPAARGNASPFEQAVAARRREVEAAVAAGEPLPDSITPAWRVTLGLPAAPPPTEDEQQRQHWLDEADRYAIVRPLCSRLIRRLGSLPADCGVEPPPPELLAAIRTGNETNQRWADSLTPAQARLYAGRDRALLGYYEAALPSTAPSG